MGKKTTNLNWWVCRSSCHQQWINEFSSCQNSMPGWFRWKLWQRSSLRWFEKNFQRSNTHSLDALRSSYVSPGLSFFKWSFIYWLHTNKNGEKVKSSLFCCSFSSLGSVTLLIFLSFATIWFQSLVKKTKFVQTKKTWRPCFLFLPLRYEKLLGPRSKLKRKPRIHRMYISSKW